MCVHNDEIIVCEWIACDYVEKCGGMLKRDRENSVHIKIPDNNVSLSQLVLQVDVGDFRCVVVIVAFQQRDEVVRCKMFIGHSVISCACPHDVHFPTRSANAWKYSSMQVSPDTTWPSIRSLVHLEHSRVQISP